MKNIRHNKQNQIYIQIKTNKLWQRTLFSDFMIKGDGKKQTKQFIQIFLFFFWLVFFIMFISAYLCLLWFWICDKSTPPKWKLSLKFFFFYRATQKWNEILMSFKYWKKPTKLSILRWAKKRKLISTDLARIWLHRNRTILKVLHHFNWFWSHCVFFFVVYRIRI